MRIPGKPRSLRARDLTDDDSDAVLFLTTTGSSSMMRGTSLEGEKTLLVLSGDTTMTSEL